jgi:hypothetical protein
MKSLYTDIIYLIFILLAIHWFGKFCIKFFSSTIKKPVSVKKRLDSINDITTTDLILPNRDKGGDHVGKV